MMTKKSVIVSVAGGLVIALALGFVWVRSERQSRMATESNTLNGRKASAIKWVQLSKLGTHELRDQIVSEFVGETTTTEDCDWRAYPTWNRSTKNPNWFGETKGVNGFNVFCKTNARDKRNTSIAIEYDFVDGLGLVGMKWGNTEHD
jgi:hypothetical protein